MKGTTQLNVSVPPELVDTLSEHLMDLGALAISLTDAYDQPLFQLAPEEEPLWQTTTIHALFPEETLLDNVIEQLRKVDSQFASLQFTTEILPDKNWVEETQKQFPPQQFGHLWVYPEWEKTELTQDIPSIYIAPGLAFGTGTHPTTKMCLEWLAANPPAQKTVVDYGCGSGILALAAIALGATEVFATDHDPQALESTKHNADCNTFDNSTLHIKKTNEMAGTKADLVLANILANPLIQLAPTLTTLLKDNGTLVLSGLLAEDIDRITEAYQKNCTVIETRYLDGWALLALTKV